MKSSLKNDLSSLMKALNNGYSIETDLRDCLGEVCISHDPVVTLTLTFSEFLMHFDRVNSIHPKIALNIKTDGLCDRVSEIISETNCFLSHDFFFFDASIPDSLSYLNKDLPIYSRLSEHEHILAFEDRCSGVWIDSFVGRYDQIKAARQSYFE